MNNKAKPNKSATEDNMTLAPYLSSRRPTTIIVTDAVRDPAVYMLDINVLDQPVSSIIGSTKTEML